MSLNQLLYNPNNAVSNRPWMDININSLRFHGDNNQDPLNYIVYNTLDTPNVLPVEPDAGTLTGTVVMDYSRVGRGVTLQINSSSIVLSNNCTFSSEAIAIDLRPLQTVQFTFPVQYNPSGYGNTSPALFQARILPSGVIQFYNIIYQSTVLPDPDRVYMISPDTATGYVPAGTMTEFFATVTYLAANT